MIVIVEFDSEVEIHDTKHEIQRSRTSRASIRIDFGMTSFSVQFLSNKYNLFLNTSKTAEIADESS